MRLAYSTGRRRRWSRRRAPRAPSCTWRVTTCAGRRCRRAAARAAWAEGGHPRRRRHGRRGRVGRRRQRVRHLLHAEGLDKGVRERAVGVGVARGLALHVDGPRVVGGVAAQEHGAVGQDHARSDGHAVAHRVGALDALAIDDRTFAPSGHAHAQLGAVHLDLLARPRWGVHDLVVVLGQQQVLGDAVAVGASYRPRRRPSSQSSCGARSPSRTRACTRQSRARCSRSCTPGPRPGRGRQSGTPARARACRRRSTAPRPRRTRPTRRGAPRTC